MASNAVDVPAEMRALVLSGTGFEALAVKTVPTPRPGPRQLLARVEAAGVCTSLIKLVEQGPKHSLMHGWDLEKHPGVLGDEGLVSLVEIGEELQGQYELGQRFVIQPAVDHAPINNRERYPNNGEGVFKLGVSYTLWGHLAEYILIPEEVLAARCALPVLSEDIAAAHGAMAEPLSCVISGQDHHVRVVQEGPLSERQVVKGLKPGGLTVIVGAGAMGRMHVDLAMSYRPGALVVTDLIDERLARVEKLFGDRARELDISLHAVNGKSTDVPALLNDLSGGRGADDVIVAVGSGAAMEAAQHFTGRAAVLNFFGGLKKGEDIVQVDSGIVHYREIVLTGSSGGSPWDVARTLELIAAGEISPETHITRVGDLEHVPEFLQMIRRQELDGKAVVYPSRRCEEIIQVDSWSDEDERRFLAGGAS